MATERPEAEETGSFELSPLFGEMAMTLGLCRPSEVVDALCFQDDLRSFGVEPGRLGQILLERGHLCEAEVVRVMEEIEARTHRLRLPGFQKLGFERLDGAARVYRGLETGSDRNVAVLILRFALAESPEEVERFKSRARSISELSHPTLEPVRALGEVEGVPWLAIDRPPGPDLTTRVREEGPLSEEAGLVVLSHIADGLRHAHSHGVVHGGLCPAAIRLSRTGGPRIEGFRLSDTGPWSATDRPRYAAPEVVRGEAGESVGTDIYSLGATLYFALTGRPPFLGEPRDVVRQHRRRFAPDPRVIKPDLTESAARLLQWMLGKSPAERPASLDEVFSALKTGAPVSRSPVEEPARAPDRLRSRRRGRR